MKNTKLASSTSGFSLVEMLVVIAVIGILAAIAVPNIGRINQAAGDSKDRRNAQQLASVANAAAAAGHDFVEIGGGDAATELTVVPLVVTGFEIPDTTSPFFGNFFGVPSLSVLEQAKAMPYLRVENGMLVYQSGL